MSNAIFWSMLILFSARPLYMPLYSCLYPWGDSGIGEAVDKRKGRLIKAGYLFRRSDNSTKKPLFDENSLKTPLSDNFSPLGKA
jgi:hypothetical protein